MGGVRVRSGGWGRGQEVCDKGAEVSIANNAILFTFARL